jgi:uncharacterized protein
MTKFLLLALLIFAVLWGPLSRLRGPKRQAPEARQPTPSKAPRPAAPEVRDHAQDIVPCAHCGVHLPRSEALAGPEHGGELFCSAEHRRLGPRTDAG